MTHTPTTVNPTEYDFEYSTNYLPEYQVITKIENKSYQESSCEIQQSKKVYCKGFNSDKGILFGTNNKALKYSANPTEVNGVDQAKSFITQGLASYIWRTEKTACVLREDNKIQCWGDKLDGIVTYNP